MAKEYKYKDVEFIVEKPDDCTMKVSRDGLSANVSVNKNRRVYSVGFQGIGWTFPADQENNALQFACDQILSRLSAPSDEELCDRLENLYEKIG